MWSAVVIGLLDAQHRHRTEQRAGHGEREERPVSAEPEDDGSGDGGREDLRQGGCDVHDAEVAGEGPPGGQHLRDEGGVHALEAAEADAHQEGHRGHPCHGGEGERYEHGTAEERGRGHHEHLAPAEPVREGSGHDGGREKAGDGGQREYGYAVDRLVVQTDVVLEDVELVAEDQEVRQVGAQPADEHPEEVGVLAWVRQQPTQELTYLEGLLGSVPARPVRVESHEDDRQGRRERGEHHVCRGDPVLEDGGEHLAEQRAAHGAEAGDSGEQAASLRWHPVGHDGRERAHREVVADLHQAPEGQHHRYGVRERHADQGQATRHHADHDPGPAPAETAAGAVRHGSRDGLGDHRDERAHRGHDRERADLRVLADRALDLEGEQGAGDSSPYESDAEVGGADARHEAAQRPAVDRRGRSRRIGRERGGNTELPGGSRHRDLLSVGRTCDWPKQYGVLFLLTRLCAGAMAAE